MPGNVKTPNPAPLHPEETATAHHIEYAPGEPLQAWQRPHPPHSLTYLRILCGIAILVVIVILILVTVGLVRNAPRVQPWMGENVTLTVMPETEYQDNCIAETTIIGWMALVIETL